MNGRKFFDTNIFVYAVDGGASKSRRMAARQLIRDAIAHREGAVSYQIIQEFINVGLRKFQAPLSIPDIRDFLDTSFAPMLVVHSSVELFHQALAIQDRYRLSWYDAVIVAAAIQSGSSILLSEDLQDGLKIGSLRIQNPFSHL